MPAKNAKGKSTARGKSRKAATGATGFPCIALCSTCRAQCTKDVGHAGRHVCRKGHQF